MYDGPDVRPFIHTLLCVMPKQFCRTTLNLTHMLTYYLFANYFAKLSTNLFRDINAIGMLRGLHSLQLLQHR